MRVSNLKQDDLGKEVYVCRQIKSIFQLCKQLKNCVSDFLGMNAVIEK